MRVTYEDRGEDACLARVHVRRSPGGFFALLGSLLPVLVRRNVAGDLERLRRALEA